MLFHSRLHPLGGKVFLVFCVWLCSTAQPNSEEFDFDQCFDMLALLDHLNSSEGLAAKVTEEILSYEELAIASMMARRVQTLNPIYIRGGSLDAENARRLFGSTPPQDPALQERFQRQSFVAKRKSSLALFPSTRIS